MQFAKEAGFALPCSSETPLFCTEVTRVDHIDINSDKSACSGHRQALEAPSCHRTNFIYQHRARAPHLYKKLLQMSCICWAFPAHKKGFELELCV